MWYRKHSYRNDGSIKFFRLKILRASSSEIEEFVKFLDNEVKNVKDDIFRISWYMRGGVNSQELFHIYSYEDRMIMNEIIKENIEATKKSGLSLI